MASQNTLVLFDMSNFIHRSFHSLPVDKFRREDGLATNAVYGTVKVMLNILTEFEKKYSYIVPIACFDTAKSKLARMNVDPNYKSQRPCAPNDLKHQFSWIRDLVTSMNISQVEMDSYEADDIIASYAHQCKDKYNRIIIVSTDKDFNQCVTDDNIYIYNIAKKAIISKNDIFEKYNVQPNHFRLYQALIGDKVDNVPGVKGIGPKVAPALVSQANGNIDTLLQLASQNALARNKSKLISDNEDVLKSSYELVSLTQTLEVNHKFPNFYLKSLKNNNAFRNFLNVMNFSSFKKYC